MGKKLVIGILAATLLSPLLLLGVGGAMLVVILAAAADANGACAPADATTVDGIPTKGTLTRPQMQALVAKHFPASEVGRAVAIARCESGWQVDTNNAGMNPDGTTDWGLFQLNDGGTLQGALDAIGVRYANLAAAQELALDPNVNVRAAAWIYSQGGWAPWVCAAPQHLGIVAALYSREPGPRYHDYDVTPAADGGATQEPGGDGWGPRIAAARQYAADQPHAMSLAVVDVTSHRLLGGFNTGHRGKVASMVKAFHLAAFLDTAADRALTGREQALLSAMIRRSDDDASVAVRQRVGPWPKAVNRFIAEQLHVPGLRLPSMESGATLVTARQMATGFSHLAAAMPDRHRAYGMGLLADLIPVHQWGMPAAAQAAGWDWQVKGGWLDGNVHQTGLLSNGGQTVAVAILQTGLDTTEAAMDAHPEREPGPATIEALTGILLGGETVDTDCGSQAGDTCGPVSEDFKQAFTANSAGVTYDDMTPDAKRVLECAESWFPGAFHPATRIGHMPTGTQAIDFMLPGSCSSNPHRTNKAQDLTAGTDLVRKLLEFHGELGVDYLIWQDHIRSPGDVPADRRWAPVASWRTDGYNNGDCTNTHYDHVHVSVYGDHGTGMPTTAAGPGGWVLPLGRQWPIATWGQAGMRKHPILGVWRCHNGSDISALGGTPIHAAAAGTVTTAGWNGGFGQYVEIDHGRGITTGYAHQSLIKVRAGQRVAAGDVIGRVGTTGLSTGDHLHYEVRKNGQAHKPQPWHRGQRLVPTGC